MSITADPTPSENDIRDSRPAACWSVTGCDWRDELPAEVTALLAPPVVVSAEAFVSRPVARDSVARDSVARDSVARDSVARAYGPRHAAADDTRTPRLITPGPSRRSRRAAHAAI